MKLASRILYLVIILKYNANCMECLGLISATAVVLASSSLRTQVGRDTNSVWRRLKESGFPKLREWQY